MNPNKCLNKDSQIAMKISGFTKFRLHFRNHQSHQKILNIYGMVEKCIGKSGEWRVRRRCIWRPLPKHRDYFVHLVNLYIYKYIENYELIHKNGMQKLINLFHQDFSWINSMANTVNARKII